MNNDCIHTHHLLLRISRGDTTAFNTLFERYRNRLFAYLHKITKSKETAEEITLDVFVRLWNGRETLEQVEDLDAYLYRIARNQAIDFLRSLKRNPALQQTVWEGLQEPSSGNNADNRLLMKNAEAIIDKAVRRLSPQRQQVFLLHHHQHFTNDEIAKRLHLSKNTVRNHLAASMEAIRKFVSQNLPVLFFLFLLKK